MVQTQNDPAATDLTAALITAGATSGAYVNCIAVDPTNADRIMVVYSNYKVKSLFASTDGGTSWDNVSGTLEQNADGSGNGPSCRWADVINDNGNTTFMLQHQRAYIQLHSKWYLNYLDTGRTPQ